jgi:hypothetical protein
MNTTQGSPAVHEWTGPTGVKFRDVREPSGTYYHDTTPRPVIDWLEIARERRSRVRFFYGRNGKDWHEENDVCGYVGRSTGRIPIALIIANNRSLDGPGILCDCICRLIVDGKEVYRHPKYRGGKFTVRAIRKGERVGKVNLLNDGYTHTVEINGERHANFKSAIKAMRWLDFMTGNRLAK